MRNLNHYYVSYELRFPEFREDSFIIVAGFMSSSTRITNRSHIATIQDLIQEQINRSCGRKPDSPRGVKLLSWMEIDPPNEAEIQEEANSHVSDFLERLTKQSRKRDSVSIRKDNTALGIDFLCALCGILIGLMLGVMYAVAIHQN